MKKTAMLLSLCLLSVSAFSATIQVPQDYSTIQGAIDAAVNGDTVQVAAGTYLERIHYDAKKIQVIGVDGPAFTVIDGMQRGSVVTFVSGCGPETLLAGFTITNGLASKGGGIYCYGSSPTLLGNLITLNVASDPMLSSAGGGIFCQSSSARIMENTICYNSAKNPSLPFADGGGVCAWIASPAF